MLKIMPAFKRFLFVLLAVGLFCFANCKQEPNLPDDPHVTLINPFTGVWNAKGEYWQFRTNGTGGKAATEAGPFGNDFSFLVYAGQDVQTVPDNGCLVIIDDAVAALYHFSIEDDRAYLHPETELGMGIILELEHISGNSQALSLTNPLIGEWSADWDGGYNGLTWSLKYRADGTIKVYHHQVKHQFENAYALRGNTLVIFGEMRFSLAPVIATLSFLENGKFQLTETQINPPPAGWIYTKVDAAEWL